MVGPGAAVIPSAKKDEKVDDKHGTSSVDILPTLVLRLLLTTLKRIGELRELKRLEVAGTWKGNKLRLE